jgi:anti-sigma factor RsiW
MNCRHFQDQLFEYVEGSLSAKALAAAEQHLAGCAACREAVREEQALAQDLTRRFRQHAEALRLSPEIRRDILAVARREPAPAARMEFIRNWWTRFAAPLSVGAAALLLGAVLWLSHFPGWREPGVGTAQRADRNLSSAVLVQLSSHVPTYEFRREGNVVIDTLSVETVAVSVMLHPYPEK